MSSHTKLEQIKKLLDAKNNSSSNEAIANLTSLMMAKLESDMEKVKGEKGDDGYTPIKGVDYFTADEIDSIAEFIQSQVKDGKDGEQGLPGKNGKNGLTPIRGVDYWTISDKDSIIADVISVIPKPKDGISPSVDEIKEKVLIDLDSRPINEKVVTKDELIAFLKRGGFRGGGGSSSGSSIILQTNGVNNGSQTLLNLVQGTNITLTDDGLGGITIDATGGGGGSPGGSDTQVQFNDSGAFGGDASFVWNKTDNRLTIAGTGVGQTGALNITRGDSVNQYIVLQESASSAGSAYLTFAGSNPGAMAMGALFTAGVPTSYVFTDTGGSPLLSIAESTGIVNIASLAGTGTRVVVADSIGDLSATNALISGSGLNTQITYWTGASTIAGSTAFTWNDTSKRFTITDGVFPGPGRAFLVDGPNYTVDMGDISSKSGRTGMTINPVAETITMFGQDSTATKVRIFEAFTNTDILGAGLSIVMGDIDNSANGTQMQLIDQSGLFRVAGANYRALNLDFASESYGFADYTQTTSGGSNVGGIEIGAGGVFNMWGLDATSTISPFLSLTGPGDITLGDLNGVGSATTFAILESSGGLYDFTSRSFQIGGHTYKFPSTQAISGQALVAQDTSGTLLYENVHRNHFAQTQSVTVANTTTPTTITGTGEGSLLVRSGTAKVGSTYELDFEGFYNATSSPTIGYKLKILGTNIGSSITNTIPSGGSSWDVRAHFKLTVLTTGASGTASLNGYITYDKNDGTSVTYPLNQTAFQAIDTTINQTTDFVATWSAADPLNSITIRQLTFNQTR